MTVQGSINYAPRTGIADLQTRLADYAAHVDELRSPEEVLNELHAVTTRNLPLPVLGAARLPVKSGDWESVQLGKSAFLHDNVPEGWWEEYEALARGKFRPALFLAGSSMASHTWTEVRRLMQPSWRSLGRCLLVAQRTFQYPDTTHSNLAFRCRQLCGIAAGATRRSRFHQVRATRPANTPGTCRPAISVYGRTIV